MGNYYARFGGGRMEQGPQGYLASRLPYDTGPVVGNPQDVLPLTASKAGPRIRA